MRAEKDLPDIAPPQKEPIVFDFGPYLPIGATLQGIPVVTVSVVRAWKVGAVDATPEARKFGTSDIGTIAAPDGSGIENAAVIQKMGTFIDGIVYLLECVCDRSDGGIAEMWLHMKCVAAN